MLIAGQNGLLLTLSTLKISYAHKRLVCDIACCSIYTEHMVPISFPFAQASGDDKIPASLFYEPLKLEIVVPL
jgi:hypothetical protein